MPEFIMDREGTVNGQEFADLSDFEQGYLEAMFFTNCSCIAMVEFASDESQARIREGQADGDIPADSGFGDIHPDSMIKTHFDCADFQSKASALLSIAYSRDYEEAQAGRDFWYTRNGHGVGFRDRDELRADDLGDLLSFAARGFGEVYVDFNPDESSPTGYGFVHLS